MNSNARWNMTLKQARDTLVFAPMIIGMGIVVLIIHYYKPDFYWNDWGQKCIRKLLGETLSDILGYVTPFFVIISGFVFWRKAIEMVDTAANEPSSDEEETTISSESNENDLSSNTSEDEEV